ncbi:unnamed protein product [Diplocarpon coronariae]|uniref:Uncharacterized protein n=1 Tax=Diplocarpon coronariae TaxID=2795749 RepID=A0A218YTV2_9HELO|nr:hypothetical protein JHW43_005923 [Diplocarpon mali]OWO98775.1 hypothetical protein B2J93_4646 [Marssonina coronariae]
MSLAFDFEFASPAPAQAPSCDSSYDRACKKLQLWYYQYEVTFSLYMLEPAEKMILNTIVLSCLALCVYGVLFFMPDFVGRGVSSLFWVYVNDGGNQLLVDTAVVPWAVVDNATMRWENLGGYSL